MSTAEHKENSALHGVGSTPDAWFDDAAARAFEAAAERVRASWDDVDVAACGTRDEGLLPPDPWLPPPAAAVPIPQAVSMAPAPMVPAAPPSPVLASASAADLVGKHAPISAPFSDFGRLPTQRTQPSVAAQWQALSRGRRWLAPGLGLAGVLLLVLAWPRSKPAVEPPHQENAQGALEAAPSSRVEAAPVAAPQPVPTPAVERARRVEPPAPVRPEAARREAPQPRKADRSAPRESRSQRAVLEPAPRKRTVRESGPARPTRARAKPETATVSAPADRPKEAPKPRKGTGFVSANPY